MVGPFAMRIDNIGPQLGMTANGARQALLKKEIFKKHHDKLLALGSRGARM